MEYIVYMNGWVEIFKRAERGAIRAKRLPLIRRIFRRNKLLKQYYEILR